MITLSMKPIDKMLYAKLEKELLNKVELGIITMYQAAKILNNYLECLGY